MLWIRGVKSKWTERADLKKKAHCCQFHPLCAYYTKFIKAYSA